MNKEEMEQIKLRTGKQLERENYLLLYKSKAQILNILLNTEEKFEQLQNNWNELKEDISYILEMIEHNKDVIKVTSDEELAIYSLQEKMQEIESRK